MRTPRDRRGRGARGPRSLPGPLTPAGTPAATSPRDRFDGWVRLAARRLRAYVGGDLADVRFAAEEAPPALPDGALREVPLGAHRPAQRGVPARVVVYRLPVLDRARGQQESVSLVLDVLVEEVADLLGRSPDELDPRRR